MYFVHSAYTMPIRQKSEINSNGFAIFVDLRHNKHFRNTTLMITNLLSDKLHKLCVAM